MRELSLNVLDVVQNSISAGASLIAVRLRENRAQHSLSISIEDDGCGMTPEQVNAVTDPFYTTRTTRKVGLGIPLFKMAAEMTGGSFSIQSVPGEGTQICACFNSDSIDFTPVGDICGTMTMLISCNPEIDFIYEYTLDGRQFVLDTRTLRETLEGVPLNMPEVTEWIRGFLQENTEELQGDTPAAAPDSEGGAV
ncbi:MAG TPA: ATP-binding protein [Firmicutes bacterium]|nr:ATP-binding protein [Bacillota bacterium]